MKKTSFTDIIIHWIIRQVIKGSIRKFKRMIRKTDNRIRMLDRLIQDTIVKEQVMNPDKNYEIMNDMDSVMQELLNRKAYYIKMVNYNVQLLEDDNDDDEKFLN